MGSWDKLEDARAEAAGWLLAVAVDHGTGSPVHRQAAGLWARAEEQVRVSLEHGDPENARRIIEQALHALSHAPAILKRNELSPEDLIGLLGG